MLGATKFHFLSLRLVFRPLNQKKKKNLSILGATICSQSQASPHTPKLPNKNREHMLGATKFHVLSLRLVFRLLSQLPIKITKICWAPQYVLKFLNHPIKISKIYFGRHKNFSSPTFAQSSVWVSSQSSRISLASSG